MAAELSHHAKTLTPAAAVLLAGLTLAAAPASAADRSVVTIDRDAARSLGAPGLRITPSSAGLTMKLGRRSAVVRGLTGSSTIAGRRVAAFTLTGRTTRTADATRVVTARLRLTAAGAKALRPRLRAPRLRAGTIGTLRTETRVPVRTTAPSTSAPAPATTPAAPAPAPAPAPQPAAPPAPQPELPPVSNATALPGADWTVRGSWLNYLAAGRGQALAQDGATRTTTGSFSLPPVSGALDPATGHGTLTTRGTARFVHASHGIDMSFSDLRFTIDGTQAIVDATFTDRNTLAGSEGTGVPTPIRLGRLVLDDVTPTRLDGDVVLTRVPLRLSAEAAKPFMYYAADEAFGAITLRAPAAR